MWDREVRSWGAGCLRSVEGLSVFWEWRPVLCKVHFQGAVWSDQAREIPPLNLFWKALLTQEQKALRVLRKLALSDLCENNVSINSWVAVVYTFNPSTGVVEAGASRRSRPERFLAQPGQHRETVLNNRKQNKKMSIIHELKKLI